MSKPPIIDFDRAYTFRSYFELPYEPEDILTEFGYTLLRSRLDLPRAAAELFELERLASLKQRIEDTLPYVSLTTEAARRELLIAPVLIEVIHYTHAQLRIEYPLTVTEQLKGFLDYYLYKSHRLLIIEAKNADLSRGFTQLAVELIALDKWDESEAPLLCGAVTTGNIWQFGQLDRRNKQVIQDVNLYPVPLNLEDVLRILVAILS